MSEQKSAGREGIFLVNPLPLISMFWDKIYGNRLKCPYTVRNPWERGYFCGREIYPEIFKWKFQYTVNTLSVKAVLVLLYTRV